MRPATGCSLEDSSTCTLRQHVRVNNRQHKSPKNSICNEEMDCLAEEFDDASLSCMELMSAVIPLVVSTEKDEPQIPCNYLCKIHSRLSNSCSLQRTDTAIGSCKRRGAWSHEKLSKTHRSWGTLFPVLCSTIEQN